MINFEDAIKIISILLTPSAILTVIAVYGLNFLNVKPATRKDNVCSEGVNRTKRMFR